MTSTRAVALVCALAVLVGLGGRALAWDPATTQAGLAEQGARASVLHRGLVERLGAGAGLFEPLRLDSASLGPSRGPILVDRLTRLDPASGGRPDDTLTQSALAWLVAGAMLAETPAERGRHHFFDPRTRRGLHDQDGGTLHGLRLAVDGGGGLRGLATGTTFDLTGRASIAWLTAPQNDLGVPVFLDAWHDAVAAETPAARQTALALALTSLGAVVAVVADAGEPAHVRNDFGGAYLVDPSGGKGHQTLAGFVAARYGRMGVPRAGKPVVRANLEAFVTAADGEGLADRTQRRFFSAGTVPDDGVVDRGTTAADVVKAARASLRFPAPAVGRLDLGKLGATHYVMDGRRRVLGYRRVPGRVRFFLDEAVLADSAAALLPDVGATIAGVINHLLRGQLVIEPSGDAGFDVKTSVALGQGKLEILSEDASGRRQIVRTVAVASVEAGQALATVNVPDGARRLVAVFRGHDGAGDLVALGQRVLTAAPTP